MIFRRIRKRVFCEFEMISQLNNNLAALSPIVYEKPIHLQNNPFFVRMRIRCYRSSRDTHIPILTTESTTQPPPNFLVSNSNKISRVARTEAQKALFDYLHCTRSFHFTDAEHISKNSPTFLHKLLSKIENNEQDVARSLSKFLRYNPINEFEPFFESLGLVPSDFTSFLPRDLMFLSDDDVLLENFHVLCDYGIPRSNMGLMYKEAKEIFSYDYGVLALKLRGYENLGLSKSTVIKLVSLCPSLLIGGVSCEFLKVLEKLKESGFENDWIGRYLSGKSTYQWNRMLDTIEFLNKVGYSEEQMGDLFKVNPALLFEGSGKTVYVLAGRLLKLGLKMDEVFSLFLQNPQILSGKNVKNLWQAVCFLFEIGMEGEDIANIVSTHTQLLSLNTLKGPRTVLKNLKVGRDSLCQMIREDPPKLLSLASRSNDGSTELAACQNPSKHLEKTTFLLKLGYTENSDEMMTASKKFRGRGDQLQERFDCLVQAGLDCNVVSNMIRQAPSVLNQTKDVIEKKIDCLRKCLGYPLESLATFPAYLCYDMGRINLRFSMYAWLREKGAAKPMLSLSTILACSDARFIKYFVDVHPEGPAMWEIIKKSSPPS